MSGSTWSELEPLILSGDLSRLVERLSTLDDASRKACVKPLKELSRSGEFGWAPPGAEPGLALVGAAVLPDARSTAGWLRRFRVDQSLWTHDELGRLQRVGSLVDVLMKRDPPWLPGMLAPLVDRLRYSRDDTTAYRLVEELRARLDLPPPADAAYVAMWVVHDWPWTGDPAPLLLAEPRFAPVVPLVFDEDGAAEHLRARRQLEVLVTTGVVDRTAVLDACLARLQRGGRPKATNDFVAVHNALAPAPDEVAERLHDYLALLPPGSASTVAAAGQRELLRLYDAGGAGLDVLVEASRRLLLRTEKKILRAQLSWLASHAASVPTDADAVAVATAAAFANPSPDVQRSAVTVVSALLPGLEPATVARVSDAAESLPADLKGPLRVSLGGVSLQEPRSAPAALSAPSSPRTVEPISTAGEVVEELLAVLRAEGVDIRGITVERIVEALPRMAAEDPAALRSAAAPVVADPTYEWGRVRQEFSNRTTLHRTLVMLLAACLGDPWDEPDDTNRFVGLQVVLCRRILALAEAVREHPGVRSVALPSLTTGAIDPDDLVRRLAQAAAEGWSPQPLDLEQALIRLAPAGASPAALAAVGTPAADLAALWAAHGGHRAPTVRQEHTAEYPRGYLGDRDPATVERTYITVARCAPDPTDPLEPGDLWSRVSVWEPPAGGVMPGWDPEVAYESWPLVLPHHRDLVAAHLLPELSRARHSRSQGVATLVPLAEADGQVGEALLVALGYGLGAMHPDARAAAVDALLVLAGRDQLDGTALGSMLGLLTLRGDLVGKRLASPLADLARAGAPTHAWAALAELLTVLLQQPTRSGGLVDLLSAAAEVAELASPTIPVVGLAELAGRSGTSRQITEARRLARMLPDANP